MASYTELNAIISSATTLKHRILIAIAIKAQGYVSAPSPTAEQIAWAKNALMNPYQYVDAVLISALAANKDATVAQINAVSDAGLQTVVDNVVQNLLAR
jgi:hypothetical protein